MTQAYHQCAALCQTLKACEEQSTSRPLKAVGVHRRHCQMIETAHTSVMWMCDFFHSHDCVRGWGTQHPTRCHYPPTCMYLNASTRWITSSCMHWSCPRIQLTNRRTTTEVSQNHHRPRTCQELQQKSCGPRVRKQVTPTLPPRRPHVPFDTSSSHSQPQWANLLMWPFP